MPNEKCCYGGVILIYVFKNERDVHGGNYKPKMKSIAVIEDILNELLLCDIWRMRNPHVSQNSWKTFNPLVHNRLTSVSTDHSTITLELQPCDREPNGPSHWKFNSSLIDDQDYVKLIKEKNTCMEKGISF